MATHTLVVGPGAIGSLFASLLLRTGCRVTILDRHPDRADHISTHGLKVDGAGAALPVHATVHPTEVEAFDLVLLCVKAYDTVNAVQDIAPVCPPGTRVVSLQNGIGNLEAIRENLPSASIFASATYHGASLCAPGHVIHAGAGKTILSPMNPADSCASLATFFDGAGIECECFSDAEALLWGKLVVNTAINPLTAIHGVTNGSLLEHGELREQMHAAAREAARVAAARGVSLVFSDPAAEAETVCRRTADNTSSMLQDIRRKRMTEVEWITGVVHREAGRLGIPVPVNDDLLFQIRGMTPLP